MPLDYSKWDKLEVSDSDDDRRPRVIKVGQSEKVELSRDGYNIVPRSQGTAKPLDLVELSKFWKRRLKNGWAYRKSHIFSQDRYDLNVLVAVNSPGKAAFDVVVTETSITVLRGGIEILKKELYARVKTAEDMINWQLLKKQVDWDALHKYCSAQHEGKDTSIQFTELYEQLFIDIDLKKDNNIADCFIWWPKLFKDDDEKINFKREGNNFMDAWNEAHKQFKERIKTFEKIEL